MAFASPHVKHEDDAFLDLDLSNYPQHHQPHWPDMMNTNMSAMSNGNSDRIFGSHTASMTAFTTGGGFVPDDELLSPFDESGPGLVQQQLPQQRHAPHLNTDAHSYTMPPSYINNSINNNMGMSAPMQPNREHLDSFQFNHQTNGQQPNGHYHNHFGRSLGESQGQSMINQAARQFALPAHGMSMPVMNQHFKPESYGSGSQQPTYPASPHHPTIFALQQQQNGTSGMNPPGGMHDGVAYRHKFNSSNQWPQSLDFNESPMDTPLTSPMDMPPRERKPEMGKSYEPAKFTPNRSKAGQLKAASVPNGNLSKEEIKRRKRRLAHNEVEQKRRDKINDRIGELSDLVPKHRLEDNKLRRQQLMNARAVGSAMSPNGASALRRSSSMSQPAQPAVMLEERDMTKGNSLDSAVAWTRDLMWLLERKLAQQILFVEALEDAGVSVPFEIPEEESRMATELSIAMSQNNLADFHYSRVDGSGLYVPHHTDATGNRLPPQAFVAHERQQKPFPNHYQSQEHGKQVPTPQYSDEEISGLMMSPDSGNEMLDFINEGNFEADMGGM